MSALIQNDCGKHWGKGGPCPKCAHFANLRAKYPNAYQYSGTPWIAVLEPIEESIQERAIRKASEVQR